MNVRLGPRTFGLSGRWLAFCPWNGSEGWLQLPLLLLLVGRDHVEIGLGTGRVYLAVDLRWRWQ